MFALLAFFLLLFAPPQQEQRFTPVDGATLQAKQQAAASAASTAAQTRFWTAYAFDVRPGVAVDFEYVSDDGRIHINNGTFIGGDWDGLQLDARVETRNLGVFLLRDTARPDIVRLEVFNLARRHEYSGYPVYWAGRASNEESLNLLRGIVDSRPLSSSDLAADAVRAISLHDDRRVPEVLERIARSSPDKDVRVQAVRSLGQHPPAASTRDFLASLARDARESHDVRRAAISAHGRVQRDAQGVAFLQGLYDSLNSQDLRRTVLSALRHNEDRAGVVNFLIRVATKDADRDLQKRATAQLGEIAGERALGTLREAATTDADTELQKQAVAAISRRPVAESVPLLIKVAQTHAKPEVRRQALVHLGRTGDPAAVEYLRSFLTK